MALRITRLQIEAAGAINRPLVRVSRVNLEVLVARTNGDTIVKSASSSLRFGQSVAVINTGLTVSNSLVFGQTVSDPLPRNLTVTSSLRFSQSAVNSLKVLAAASSLRFQHKAAKGVVVATATNALQFSQAAAKVQVKASATALTPSSSLRFSQLIVQNATELPVSNSLRFSQAAVLSTFRFVTSQLKFGQTASIARTLPRTLSQTLRFGQLVLPEKGSPDLCQYNPTIAGGTIPGLPTPPSATPPVLTRQKTIKLFHPIVSPTLTVVLRSPTLGDRDRLQFERIFRESRGGTLDVAPGGKVQQKVVALTIVGLKESEGQAFLNFIDKTLGQEVGLTDWEGRSSKGVVLTTAEPVVRNRPDTVDVTFEFIVEGSL